MYFKKMKTYYKNTSFTFSPSLCIKIFFNYFSCIKNYVYIISGFFQLNTDYFKIKHSLVFLFNLF